MARLILVDAPSPFPTGRAFARAAAREGRVHILDLAGFSALTELRIAEDPKRGLEEISRLVAGFFSALSARFSEAGINYGGFAGDALIATGAAGAPPVSAAAFRELAGEAARAASEPLSFRTGQADGTFHEAEGGAGSPVASLIWGPAVSSAFAAMHEAPGNHAEPGAARRTLDHDFGASASIVQRWSLLVRLFDPQAAALAAPATVTQLVSICAEIAEGQGAILENAAQDDKGLILVFALLRDSEAQAATLRDTLLQALEGLGIPAKAVTARGHLFHCQPEFSGARRRVVFGAALNRAAKALQLAPQGAVLQPAGPSLVAGQEASFVGRQEELGRLSALRRISQTRPITAFLTGPAGIGKSAIVREFVRTRMTAPAHVELTPVDGYIALGAIRRVASSCGLGEEFAASPEALAKLGEALPDELVIENWHWCDPDSRRLILQLARARPAGLLLLTSRSAASPDDGQVEPVPVGPLDAEAARALLSQSAPATDAAEDREALIRLAEGSPFWLIQAGLSPERTFAGPDPSPVAFEALLSLRARALSVRAISLWRVHSAWRTWLRPEEAASLLAELGLEAGAAQVEELKALGWLEEDPGAGLRPAHDILADWGVSDLPASFERALNLRLARRLEGQAAPAARIAAHWARAGEGLRAAALYERAAKEAASLGAHAGCLKNLEQARTLAGTSVRPGSARAARHLALAALAHWGAGRLRRAEQSLIEFDKVASRLDRPARIRSDRLMAAFVRSEIGQFSGNAQLILTGIIDGTRFDVSAPESHMARARRASFLYYLMGLARLPVGGAFARLTSDAVRREDARSETSLRLSAATLAMSFCRWDEAEEQLERAIDAAGRSDDVQMLGTAITLSALCNLFQGEAGAALQGFQGLEEIGSAQGHQLFSVWAAYGMGESLHYGGDLAAAKAAVLLADARRTGLGDHQSSCIIEGMLAQLALANRDFAEAERRARNALRYARRLPPSNFSTLEGIAAPAEIGARLTALFGPSPARTELITEGLAALRRYSGPFKLARPRLALADGRRAEAIGDRRAASKAYRRAGALGRALGMQFEHRLAEAALADLEKDIRA